MKTFRLLAGLIAGAGLCLTGRAVYLHAKACLAGMLIRSAWEDSFVTGVTRPPWPWADTRPIARLRIPRIGYDEIVLEGATPRTLAFGPARLLSGVRVGEPGNLVLAGHRTSWFRRLEGARQGDTVELQWFDPRRRVRQERRYSIAMIRVVEPDNLALLAPTAGDALTLLTCYPFGSSPRSPQRYVARAVPLTTSAL